MELITVLTPTYNRAHTLTRLFRSLQNQSVRNFLWMVIDDGSSDDTKQLIASIIPQADFTVLYFRKENGGKHTALNYAFNYLSTELTLIVDSDDFLTDDALETIEKHWNQVQGNRTVAGISFLRGSSEANVIGSCFPADDAIMNPIDIQFRYKVSGDKAEVWRSSILTKYRFPVFSGERFLGLRYLWWQIGTEYHLLYKNKIIYITEYMEGGLTRLGRPLRIRCPHGGMETSKIAFGKKFPLYARIKYAILYNCYADFAKEGLRSRLQSVDHAKLLVTLTSIPGKLLYYYWNKKYL